MSNIYEELNKIPERFSDENFLSNKGLSNEVGLYVFCYAANDELTVRNYFEELKTKENDVFNIIECDLYKIFLEICEDKHILKSIPNMEIRKGKDFLNEQLQKIATPEAFVEKMKFSPHKHGDILIITGLGKVFPFMRSHKILDNIQHLFEDIPVVMLYPGKYNGQDLQLFNKIKDGNYYRAFNLM